MYAGIAIAARMPTIAMTVTSSISEKPYAEVARNAERTPWVERWYRATGVAFCRVNRVRNFVLHSHLESEAATRTVCGAMRPTEVLLDDDRSRRQPRYRIACSRWAGGFASPPHDSFARVLRESIATWRARPLGGCPASDVRRATCRRHTVSLTGSVAAATARHTCWDAVCAIACSAHRASGAAPRYDGRCCARSRARTCRDQSRGRSVAMTVFAA